MYIYIRNFTGGEASNEDTKVQNNQEDYNCREFKATNCALHNCLLQMWITLLPKGREEFVTRQNSIISARTTGFKNERKINL